MSERLLPKVSLQLPGYDGRLADYFVADADSKKPDDLHAALDYILAAPGETLRKVTRKAK